MSPRSPASQRGRSASATSTGAAVDGLGDGAAEADLLVQATWVVAVRTASIEPGVREILQEAGLSTKAFYRHFRSKDELLLVAMNRGSQVLVEYLEHRMEGVPDPVSKIREWILGCLRQAANPAAARRLLPWTLGIGRIATMFPKQIERNQASIVALLEREIAHAVADGSGRSSDPAADAMIIYAYTAYTVQKHLINGTAPKAATTNQLVEFAYRALGVQPGTS